MIVKAVTEFNSEIIKQHLTFDGVRQSVTEDVIKIKEQGVRDALISMGWTPPTDISNKALIEVLEDICDLEEGAIGRAAKLLDEIKGEG